MKKLLIAALFVPLVGCDAAPSCDDSAVIQEAERLAKEHIMDTYAATFSGYTGMTYEELENRVKAGTEFLNQAYETTQEMGEKVSVKVSAARAVDDSKGGQTMCRAKFTVNRPDGSTAVNLKYSVFKSKGDTYVELFFN